MAEKEIGLDVHVKFGDKGQTILLEICDPLNLTKRTNEQWSTQLVATGDKAVRRAVKKLDK